MTGVALLDRSFDQASAPESCGESRLPATSVAQKSCHHELFGLVASQLGGVAARNLGARSTNAQAVDVGEH
jgi:hypothetical protein